MAESCLHLLDSVIADVFFRKIKQFHWFNVSFQKKFLSSDHLIVTTTNINIYIDYILVKTMRKNGHHKAILRLHNCLLMSEKYL